MQMGSFRLADTDKPRGKLLPLTEPFIPRQGLHLSPHSGTWLAGWQPQAQTGRTQIQNGSGRATRSPHSEALPSVSPSPDALASGAHQAPLLPTHAGGCCPVAMPSRHLTLCVPWPEALKRDSSKKPSGNYSLPAFLQKIILLQRTA